VSADAAELARRLFAAYGRGAWAEALEAAEGYTELAPDEAEPLYWVACLRSLVGDGAGAVAALEDGVARGFWWSPSMLREDDDLRRAQDEPGFARVVEVSERRMGEARRGAVPTLVVEGDGGDVLLALHGRMGNAQRALEAWRPAVGAGLRVAALGSSQLWASGVAGWDDLETARRELDWAEGQLGAAPAVIGGFSQGGILAIVEALRGRADVFVALAPSFARVGMPALEELRPLLGREGLRGAILVGGDDLRVEHARAFAAASEAAGTPVLLEVVEGLDPTYPADLDERLPRLLDFALGR
jgi:hypothetical protein